MKRLSLIVSFLIIGSTAQCFAEEDLPFVGKPLVGMETEVTIELPKSFCVPLSKDEQDYIAETGKVPFRPSLKWVFFHVPKIRQYAIWLNDVLVYNNKVEALRGSPPIRTLSSSYLRPGHFILRVREIESGVEAKHEFDVGKIGEIRIVCKSKNPKTPIVLETREVQFGYR
jgi:hypothetical protein